MGETAFGVSISADAWADLDELADFWIVRREEWRAEKYSRDLVRAARAELSDPVRARRGRRLRSCNHPDAREILAFGIYRIIYDIDEAAARVDVLRFWDAHRDDPPFD